MSHAELTLGGEVLARLEDVRPDMPWFEARFVATDSFAIVEPLFQNERALAEDDQFDVAAWQRVWEAIWERGVTLVLPDGTRIARDYAVHVYEDGTARFRY
jgi:hypothetical protein